VVALTNTIALLQPKWRYGYIINWKKKQRRDRLDYESLPRLTESMLKRLHPEQDWDNIEDWSRILLFMIQIPLRDILCSGPDRLDAAIWIRESMDGCQVRPWNGEW